MTKYDFLHNGDQISTSWRDKSALRNVMKPKATTKAKPFKKDPPALAKREEAQHKDLDGDGEKGESPAHRAKVLGKKTPTKKVK